LEQLRINRDDLISSLQRKGVSCSVHFIPLHMHPYYQRAYGYRMGDFPCAEQQYGCCLSLPIFPTMTEMEIDHVIRVVRETIMDSRIVHTNAAISPNV
jgi:perosamine synthetase